MLVFFVISLIATVFGEYDEKPSIPVSITPSKICSEKSNDPQIYLKPESEYKIRLGQELKIRCGAHGMPTPLVYWIKGKNDMSGKEKRLPITGMGEAMLYFDEVEKDDVDVYTCVVEDCCRGTIQRFETQITVNKNVQCSDTNKSTYFWVVMWEYRNWTDARNFCESRGMQLAAPQNSEENKELHKQIQISMGADPNGKKFAHHNMVWIGYTDGLVEGQFTNINTGNPMNYSNWMNKQPDNWRKHDKKGQDCVSIDKVSGEWDDSYEFYERPFSCVCPPKVGK